MDELLDLVGVVDGADHAAEVGEACHLSLLEGAGFLSGAFEFDEADFSAGEDDDSVGHAGCSGAGEFWGYSSFIFDLSDQCFFDFTF